jgi:hypothetical protein
MTVISRLISRLSTEVAGDGLQRTEVMSLLSKSEMSSPKPQFQNGQAWGRGGREATAATILLKTVRPSACVGLAEGSCEVGWGQGLNAWGKLCNYYNITIVMNKPGRSAEASPAIFTQNLILRKLKWPRFYKTKPLSSLESPHFSEERPKTAPFCKTKPLGPLESKLNSAERPKKGFSATNPVGSGFSARTASSGPRPSRSRSLRSGQA